MRFWNWFYTIVTAIIVVGMMVPHYFGMESYTQWGGMYTAGWCGARLTHVPPQGPYDNLASEYKKAKYMHNFRTCMIWANKWCGYNDGENPVINLVQPSYRNEYPFKTANICDFSIYDSPWFTTI